MNTRYAVTQTEDPIAGTIYTLHDREAKVRASAAPGCGFIWSSLTVDHRDYGVVELLYHGNDFLRARENGGMNPVLFPVLGRLKHKGEEGCYIYEDRKYYMDIHGFAKDTAWRDVQAEATEEGVYVGAKIEHTAETMSSYPFAFSFRLTYRLSEGGLYLILHIEDEGPFSVGFHPYFNTPFVPEVGTKADCTMTIPARQYWELEDLVPTGSVIDLKEPYSEGICCAGRDLDVVLTNLIADDRGMHRSTVQDSSSGIRVDLEANIDPFSEIVVYTPADEAYVCIENWTSPPNILNCETTWPARPSRLDASIRITPAFPLRLS